MLDFLNGYLENNEVDILSMLPIHVDNGIIYNYFSNFGSSLIENLEDYYKSKNKVCLSIHSGYSYQLKASNCIAPTICKLDYNDFLYYIEFTNSKTKRAITLGMENDSSQLDMNFYSGFNTEKVNLKGSLTLVSNIYNNGISVQLLNIIYEYMENDLLDMDDLFKKLIIN